MINKHILIIGGGPSGLMAAQEFAKKGFDVHVYEQNKAVARKFLVAGNGGFNLTHNEEISLFVEKYDAPQIKSIVRSFDNKATTNWLKEIGIDTYVGSSGKIFPEKKTKPIQVLNAWLKHLTDLGVTIHYEHRLIDFNDGKAKFIHNEEILEVSYSKLILAMGGGSWKKTGSDAKWIEILNQKKIEIKELEAANSGYNTPPIYHQLEGQYLKNTKVNFRDIEKLGEIVFTNYGIEGSAIYYLNRFTRSTKFPLTLNLDLKPQMSEIQILDILKNGGNINQILKSKLKLSNPAISLLKFLKKDDYIDPNKLAKLIKNYPIDVLGLRPIDEVISTAGGVKLSELKENLELKKLPNVYCIGEMIDWEAPTGGYLLQACFSTGFWVAHS